MDPEENRIPPQQFQNPPSPELENNSTFNSNTTTHQTLTVPAPAQIGLSSFSFLHDGDCNSNNKTSNLGSFMDVFNPAYFSSSAIFDDLLQNYIATPNTTPATNMMINQPPPELYSDVIHTPATPNSSSISSSSANDKKRDGRTRNLEEEDDEEEEVDNDDDGDGEDDDDINSQNHNKEYALFSLLCCLFSSL